MGRWDLIIPISAKNRIGNPSFERDITGYNPVGSTLTRITTVRRRGAYGCRIAPTAGLNDGMFYILYVPATTTGVFSVDVLGEPSVPYKLYVWDPTALSTLAVTNFTGSGVWDRVQVGATTGVNTAIHLYLSKRNSTSTALFYTDGWMWVDTPFASDTFMYFDGDSKGAVWESVPHHSPSLLGENSEEAGIILPLESISVDGQGDSDILVQQQTGTGAPPVTNLALPYGAAHGARFQRTLIPERPFTLKALVKGEDWDDFNLTRRRLIERVQPGQRMQIRYRGADTNLLLGAVYDSGLELQGQQGFSESPGIRFIAYDPFWREEGSDSASLILQYGTTISYVMVRDPDGNYRHVGNALNGRVNVIRISPTGVMWIGGNFLTAGGVTVNRIAYLDEITNTWKKVNTEPTPGVNGEVFALEFTPYGHVIVGGAFSSAGGVANTNGVAYLTFLALGLGNFVSMNVNGFGVGSICYALKFAIYNPPGYIVSTEESVFVGGSSTLFNDLAYWDFTTSMLTVGNGTGVAGTTVVKCLDVQDLTLIVGGRFDNIYGATLVAVPSENVAFGDLSNGVSSLLFRVVNPGFRVSGVAASATVNSMCVLPSGDVIFQGLFNESFGNSTPGIALYNGVTTYPMGSGISNWSGGNRSMAITPAGSLLIISSDHLFDGAAQPGPIAEWTGTLYLPTDLPAKAGASDPACLLARPDGGVFIGYYTVANPTVTEFGAVVTLNNTGTAPCGVTIAIRGACRPWKVTNNRSGMSLCLDGPGLGGGEWLTMRCGQHESTIESNWRGDMTRVLTPGSQLSSFVLLPGINPISVYAQQISSESLVVAFWSKTHWSIDSQIS